MELLAVTDRQCFYRAGDYTVIKVHGEKREYRPDQPVEFKDVYLIWIGSANPVSDIYLKLSCGRIVVIVAFVAYLLIVNSRREGTYYEAIQPVRCA